MSFKAAESDENFCRLASPRYWFSCVKMVEIAAGRRRRRACCHCRRANAEARKVVSRSIVSVASKPSFNWSVANVAQVRSVHGEISRPVSEFPNPHFQRILNCGMRRGLTAKSCTG